MQTKPVHTTLPVQADEVAMLGGGEFMKFVLYLIHERAWSLVTLL